MPISENSSHHFTVQTAATPIEHIEVLAAHDCHEATADPLKEIHAQIALHDVPVQSADCHDDLCQLCGVCHQGLSLTAWPLVMPVFLAHPLPISATWAHVASMSAPLIKPPIS